MCVHYPFWRLSSIMPTCVLALNASYLQEEASAAVQLRDGDQLAVIPPISGGWCGTASLHTWLRTRCFQCSASDLCQHRVIWRFLFIFHPHYFGAVCVRVYCFWPRSDVSSMFQPLLSRTKCRKSRGSSKPKSGGSGGHNAMAETSVLGGCFAAFNIKMPKAIVL